MSGSFEGKVAAVTGAARGIGAAIVDELTQKGAEAVSLDLTVPGVSRPGVLDLPCDVADEDAVAEAFAKIADRFGHLDVLVNNAGIQRAAPTHLMEPETWDLVVGIHLRGMFLCSAQAIPLLKGSGGGAIISIASTAGFLGLPGRGPYSAAKAGIMGLTRSLSVELAPAGIRVNAVAPGFTLTPLVQQGLDDGSLTSEWMLDMIPMDRLADPSEIAKPVVFLASEESSYITGQCLVVDGGWTIQGVAHRPDWLEA